MKGYSCCIVGDIVRRANVSQGTLYVHCKSKEALFQARIEKEYGEGTEKRKARLLQTVSLGDHQYPDRVRPRNVRFPIDHRLWTEILAVAARDEAVHKVFLASDRAMREQFTALPRKTAEAREIDDSLDFDAISIWLYALVDNLIARTGDDANFGFPKYVHIFETLIRRALRPQSEFALPVVPPKKK